MEEWVGQRWHRFITRAADRTYPQAAVSLDQVQRAIEMLFRAGGGDALVRVAPASAQKVGGPRTWLERIAGQGERAVVSALDGEALALPPVLAVFDDRQLNRDLYLWLAALSAAHGPAHEPLYELSPPLSQASSATDWIGRNLSATALALERFPGLRRRYQRLAQAHLAQRPDPAHLRGAAADTERAVQRALHDTLDQGAAAAPAHAAADHAPSAAFQPETVAPVWVWLHAYRPDTSDLTDTGASNSSVNDQKRSEKPTDQRVQQDHKRRRAEHTKDSSNKSGLVLYFRAESILSWSEFVRVNRTADDDDLDDASDVADDLEQLAIARDDQTLAARVKFDLDLPSASADELPVGEGEPLPEWDFKRAALLPDRCIAQRLRTRPEAATLAEASADAALPTSPAAEMQQRLKGTSRQVRRRFEALRAAPRWQHGLTQGEELNLDAWVRFQVDRSDHTHTHVESPAVFSSRMRSERSLSTVMLADLSLSTDAYATSQARVIDLVRDSLYVFGQALQAVGDPFEMLGFSSVRRLLRVHELKRFGEPWNDAARERVAAIKPGFYTRMGAAIRFGTQRLAERPERQKLLLILSDGKPNDLDQYEGRYGLEDTRHAVLAARQAGLVPFCVTIDEQAHAYLARLFGAQGYALVHHPEQLARALTQVYVRLTANAR
ncbi:nitric oxide reductase activation protein NorD [Ottowia sp.]|uniref:nitric oxide reductase activation protein NorD n=1 Tax=Ottowia sp. TaxID=1898956 RepID=UPI003A873EBF